jgi:hypothetical protein
MTVLGTRALNRATLVRQLLLDHADLPVLDAVAHLGGLRAQQPQEPFVGLWSRLRAFDPAVLSDLLTAEDVLAWRARPEPIAPLSPSKGRHWRRSCPTTTAPHPDRGVLRQVAHAGSLDAERRRTT